MSALAAAAGLTTFAAALGVGLLALGALRVRLPAPWRAVTALVAGLHVESALVQYAAMAGASTRPVLVALWSVFVVAGLAGLLRAWRGGDALDLAPPDPRPRGAAEWVPLAIGLAAIAANLLVAAAPSTKIDETYYHMLLPRRIVADGALRFYLYPWESAALPQMAYQIGAAPLHALGVPDAPNVTSWALEATLAWLGWRLLADDARTRPLAPWWVAVATVGLYGVVWHVTGGAHALGDLALAAAVVAVADPRRAGVERSPASYALMVGALTYAAASTKATLLPVSALLLAWGAAVAWARAREQGRVHVLAAAGAPWLLFGAPIVAWTWHASGAPYGPFFAWLFPRSAYAGDRIRAVLETTRAWNRRPPHGVPRELIARQSPLYWLAAVAAAAGALRLSRRTRLALAAVVALHVAFVLAWVSWDPRFLAGAPFGLALLFALHGRTGERWRRWAAPAALLLLLAPWLAVQLYYARPFVAVTLGVTSRERFLARYSELHDDWRVLDARLPRDAIILSGLGRTSATYAPRPIVFSPRDLAGDDERRRAYVLSFACDAGGGRGPVVYVNPRAVVAAYRTPGHAPDVTSVCVRKLE